MRPEEILDLTEKLIAIPSVTGNERPVNDFLCAFFSERGWKPEKHPVEGERYNIYVPFGAPKVVFTTHTDVVPAPAQMFTPRREGGKIIGRGACDAKGIAATMVGVVDELARAGRDGFALLLVVGEEVDGIGALSAGKKLAGRGVQYIVNGEPTEGKLMIAHKGAVGCRAVFEGSACHSGYPELGADANAKLVRAAHALMNANFGSDPKLGPATLNIGKIEGGLASNIVSPEASMNFLVRTVGDNDDVLKKIAVACEEAAETDVYYNLEPARMESVPGFETAVASYCTDIPNFHALGARAVLYGPGSIHDAHTDRECLGLEEVSQCLDGYIRIFDHLSRN